MNCRYIAFLRAINVGGHTVTMDRLKKLLEALKLARVETFIASGNVAFEFRGKDPEALARRIEKHLEKSLGYEVATFLRTADELAAVAFYQPFSKAQLADPTNVLYVAFVASPPDADARLRVAAYQAKAFEFHVHGREVYCLFRTKFSDSEFSGAKFERALGMPATLRNITTVRKLAAKYPPASSS